MQIRVLGCSGGISKGFDTSCYLIDKHTLIDAGTGLGNLALNEMSLIEDVFITHPHMDHIACLPSFIDTVLKDRQKPIHIWGSESTISLLKKHIFNDAIWPDFSKIPSLENPFMRFNIIEDDTSVSIHGLTITSIPVAHTIPTVAYQLTNSSGNSYVICGDTGKQETFWETINQIPNLKGLAIETAFCDEEATLASIAKHLSPQILFEELSKLTQDIPIHIMHLKPGRTGKILDQLREYSRQRTLDIMFNDQIIEI